MNGEITDERKCLGSAGHRRVDTVERQRHQVDLRKLRCLERATLPTGATV
jgi:hypothetical protein